MGLRLKAAALCLAVTLLIPARAHLDEVQYVYDDLGRLIAVIDSSGEAAIYTYDAVGNLLSITRSASGQVAIFSFSPKEGSEGTVVTIQGTGFSSTTSENQVVFGGGVTATVSDSIGTTIETTVPAGAVTGPISVTTASGSAVSQAPFEVVSSAPPVITSVFPTFGFVGQIIEQFSITGENLENAVEMSFDPQDGIIVTNPPLVTLNGTQATVRVTIIPTAPGGGRVVTIQTAKGTSSAHSTPANTFGVLSLGASGIGSPLRIFVEPPPKPVLTPPLRILVGPTPDPVLSPMLGIEVVPP